jgi:hypothetical protein
MKKAELVRALAKHLNVDGYWLRRRLRPFQGKIEDVQLHTWSHELVGDEGAVAYLIRKTGEVYRLRCGWTDISNSGRVLRDEDAIPLIDSLILLEDKDIEIDDGDVIIIEEFCDREDRDHYDYFYYIKVDASFKSMIYEAKKKLEEEEL